MDAADPDAADHVEVVEQTLSEIGAGGVPRITVLNQIDRVRDPILLKLLESRLPETVRTSAITGQGLEELRDAVHRYVIRRHLDLVLEVDPADGRLLAQLREWGEVDEADYQEGKVVVRVRIAPRFLDRIRGAGALVLEGAPPPVDEDDETS